ncbi:hypothetical protein [Gymnodinialimonas ceratoperidinii]|uniref:Uncharacterized protein n=1 Tax=Gymnodinialimonas ceratoperidinii TaxID=2856823 RepID=A0A8F6TTQ4_9RHOB|nr:hypothetical protein [Gymnodinialimonas ceratoperidinii]QXT38505.1 hypothetical protein KYE46_11185 [Gymnodinialimonas ceratoperidinii]
MFDPGVFLPLAMTALIGMFAIMLIVGIPRGRRLQKTNEQIEANQTRQIAMQERQLAAAERQATAQERIAAALESRGE